MTNDMHTMLSARLYSGAHLYLVSQGGLQETSVLKLEI